LQRRQIQLVVGLAALLFLGARLSAQSPDPGPVAAAAGAPGDPIVQAILSDVTRVETWSFFTPFAGDVDPDYTLVGNRATLAVSLRGRHVDLRGAFQYAQLLGAPNDASYLGPLGPGASYFDASGAPRSYQLYIRAMSMRVKGAGLSVEVGRTDFTSAADGPPRSAAIERLTSERLAGRLIGGAEWTPFERAFDGVRLDLGRRRWRATSALIFPTQGAFEESANPTISALRVVTGTLAIGWPGREDSTGESVPSSELQVFAAHYRDRRSVSGRPDNADRVADSVDVAIGTIGVSHVSVIPWRGGQFQSVVWAAGQGGDWYGLEHRAFSAIAEGGYEFRSKWQPGVRAGYLYASGDDEPGDGRHETFFPLLPTTMPALLGGTFAQMNLRQLFAGGRLTLSPRFGVSASVSQLSLARPGDCWYSGTGATASRGTYFGFFARPSGFATGLGTLVQAGAETTVARHWRLKADVGVMRGGDVVRQLFSGTRLVVFALESRVLLGG
jgi:hypothetical protein